MQKFFVCALLGAMLGTADVAHAAQLVLQPDNGKDAQIVDGGQAGINYGNYQYVMDNWSGNARSVGLLQFDLSALPPGAVVSSATLSLYHIFNSNPGARYDVFQITSDWDENTVTFNTAPTYNPVAVSSLILGDGVNVFRDWDITSLVNGWSTGLFANYGLWLEEIPIAGDSRAYFYSSDNANPAFDPKLAITFDATVVPEPSTFAFVTLGLLGIAGGVRRKQKLAQR